MVHRKEGLETVINTLTQGKETFGIKRCDLDSTVNTIERNFLQPDQLQGKGKRVEIH